MKVHKEERQRFELIVALLNELGIYTDARAAALLALTDEETPNRFSTLRAAGMPMAAAARTAHVFDDIAKRLGLPKRLDREQRDYVFVQLREVGLIDICWVLPKEEAARQKKLIKYGFHDSKSPNNAYALTDEARQLLLGISKEEWPKAMATWISGDRQRRLRVAQRVAMQTIAASGSSSAQHGALIRSCVTALLNSVAIGFELVFIDDSDGARIAPEWDDRLDELGLKPDLDSLWPDGLVVEPDGKRVWFVDAVTTDGEIDETRARALRRWAEDRGYTVAGMTTAYATWKDVARRQGAHQNLAVGSTLWVAEDGGKLLSVGAAV